jgi:hypothetical protein
MIDYVLMQAMDNTSNFIIPRQSHCSVSEAVRQIREKAKRGSWVE